MRDDAQQHGACGDGDDRVIPAPWYVIRSDNKRPARLNAISHILSKIPYEELPRKKVKLPKQQDAGDYEETNYPFRLIPEVFDHCET